MEKSYNGWTASPTPKDFGGLTQLRVGTETFPPGVRAGAVHTVLSYVATQLDRRVEPVAFPGGHEADDWGWNYRANKNNPATLSCHASGTAFDYNATRHPNGRSGTWSAKQATEIKKILAEVDNVVRCLWGYDEMHFEIVASPATVAMVADRLTRSGDSVSPIDQLPPVPPKPEGFLMALNDAQQAEVYNLIVQRLAAPIPNQVLDALVGGAGGGQALWANISQIRADLGAVLGGVIALTARPESAGGISRDELVQVITDAIPDDIAADVASRLRIVAA